MVIFRSIGTLLPQSLVLLILGAPLNLHEKWHIASLEFVGMAIVLFVLSPIITASLLIVEFRNYRKQSEIALDPVSLLFPGLASILFVEALIVDAFIFSQLGNWADAVGFGM